jgi:hypothetical protein
MADPIEEFLSNFPGEIRKITGELRKMARSAMPRAHEFLYYDAVNYSVNDSPLGRICYISPMEKYDNVGFLFGARLDDPGHLLEGNGKRARHVKIKTMGEAKNPALRDLVKAAWTHGTEPVPNVKQKTTQAAKSQRGRR